MTYLASQLVTNAWYLSGIVARNLQQVDGDQVSDGLQLLNNLLAFKGTDIRLIPYFQSFDVTLNNGQEIYFIDNLVDIETMYFLLNNVRFPMTPVNRDRYFGSYRVANISSLPTYYHLERAEGGSNVYVYPLPNQNYEASLFGKFALTNVTAFQDLSLVYDGFYIEYLRYALASMMCDEYDIEFPAYKAQRLKSYEKKLMDVSPTDLTIQKISTLQKDTGINWGYINFPGWTPGDAP